VGEGVVPTDPLIASASYAKPLLSIDGANFGDARPVVRVNGVDVSGRIRTNTTTNISVKGGPKKLNLRAGANEIQVVANGEASNIYILAR
jgi:hypothetical protein